MERLGWLAKVKKDGMGEMGEWANERMRPDLVEVTFLNYSGFSWFAQLGQLTSLLPVPE